MTACILAATLVWGCQAAAPASGAYAAIRPEPATVVVDAWFAEDKARHFAISFAATLFAYAGARFVLDADDARLAAGGTALALGVGKEIHDRRTGGMFSLRDLAWDAAGVGLGLVLATRIH